VAASRPWIVTLGLAADEIAHARSDRLQEESARRQIAASVGKVMPPGSFAFVPILIEGLCRYSFIPMVPIGIPA
jgi:hypothetical protein